MTKLFKYAKYTFVEPEEPPRYEDWMNRSDYKDIYERNFNEWLKWNRYHNKIGIPISEVLKVLILIAVFWFVFFIVNSCMEEYNGKKSEIDEIRKIVKGKYDPHVLENINHEYRQFSSKGISAMIVENVVKERPLVIGQTTIDGCEYLAWINDGNVMLCHKGNCKSEVHKK